MTGNASTGIYLSGSENVTLRNNIVTASGAGACAVFTAGGSSGPLLPSSDYNDLYASGGAITGYYLRLDRGIVCRTLADWQLNTGQDLNSIGADPWFANAAGGDFHVMSNGGRYDPATNQPPSNPIAWVTDNRTSPVIDKGDPASPWAAEPMPNGARVNMGAYANTEQASRTDITDPALISFSLTPNTVVSPPPAFVTNSATPTLTLGFSEWVVAASSDITVTDPLGGNVSDAVTGLPGDTITVTLNLPLSASGVYALTVWGTVKDTYGNRFNGGTAVTCTFTFDNIRPTVSTYSISPDTGVSNSDQITNNPTPVVTYVFSEPVYGAAANVTVAGAVHGAVTPNTIAGWGTNTLTLTFTTALLDDVYTVTLDGSSGFPVTDNAHNHLSGNQPNGDDVPHFHDRHAEPDGNQRIAESDDGNRRERGDGDVCGEDRL